MLSPVGAFVQAIIGIYNTVMFFVERLKQIASVAAAFIDSIAAIAAGSLGPAAARVESVLGGILTMVISFLARLVGLGDVSEFVVDKIKALQERVAQALETGVNFIVGKAKAFIAGLVAKVTGKEDKDDADPDKQAKIAAGLAAIDAADEAATQDGTIDKESAEKVAASVRAQHPVFKSITVVEAADSFDYSYEASPKKTKKGAPKKGTVGPLGITRASLSFTAGTKNFLIDKFRSAFPPDQLGQWKEAKLKPSAR
jgi:hypothetical protein